MDYLALASDYDETLASHGRLDDATIAAIERCRASGRQVILVTGREIDDLARVCPRVDLFARIVAENGALMVDPARGRETVLGPPPPAALVGALRAQGVSPLSVGRVIVATREPHQLVALETIRALGLEYEVIFNKGAVMVLPSGINKATGLKAALVELGLSAAAVVGVGDAENDHSLLRFCGYAVAVANALPSLKAGADLVTDLPAGAGVAELIDRLIAGTLPAVHVRQSSRV
jgi:hydroxymethylpyrimidine pyrophosphatase-like HAD family hydrolase